MMLVDGDPFALCVFMILDFLCGLCGMDPKAHSTLFLDSS